MIKYHTDIIQGTDEWHAQRCGILTASEMDLIITPTLKVAENDKARTHLYELLAQRVNKYVEPHYISDDMLRGWEDEIEAKQLYSKHYASVTDCGFVTNDDYGFTLGYSPDGLVGDDGLVECKSRRQKYQMQTILSGAVPKEHILQCHTGLIVSGRKWIDYVSYCGGMPLFVLRVYPDAKIHDAIVEAATTFETELTAKMEHYIELSSKLIKTERKERGEIVV